MKKNEFFAQNKHFFVEDVEAVKQYVLNHCPQSEIAKIIERADEACAQSFRFDLRWDMEYTEIPVVFDKEINWLHQPADDPEWIFAFNRHHFWITLGQAYVLTGDEKYAEAFVRQCKSWICQINLRDPDCANACRTLETGIRMNLWIKAFCLFRNSPALTDSFCSLFEESMIEQEKFIAEVWNSTKIISNWGVLENHGLFTAALLMPEHPFSAAMLQESLHRLDLQLQRQVYPDGVHWEQSTMYHNEVAQDFLEVKILADRNHIELPEGYNERLAKMIEFCVEHKKPDGIEMAMGDSDDIDVRDIITKAAYSFNNPQWKAAGYTEFDFDCVFDLGVEAAAAYAAMPALPSGRRTAVFPDSGHIFWHSSDTEDQTWLHFTNGVHGGGHAHEDKLHVDLFYRGEDIVRDSGRLTYVDKPERFEFKGPKAHNVIELDDQPSILCKRSWGYHKLSWSLNTQASESCGFRLAQGAALGYMDLETGSAVLSRKVVWLREDLILVHDEIYANPKDTHKIVQRWHFSPAAEVTLKGQTTALSLNHSDCEVLTLADNAQVRLTDTRLSLHYNTTTPSKMLETELNASGFASITTIFSLNPKGEKAPCFAVNAPVSLVSRQDRPFAKKVAEGWVIQKGADQFTVMIAHEDYMGPSDAVLVNERQGMGHVIVWSGMDKEQWGTTLAF